MTFLFSNSVSIEIFCAQHMNERIDNPGNCARFIDCRPNIVHPELGRHQGECPYPQLYSASTRRCEDFQKVSCTTRYEPRAPCKFYIKGPPMSSGYSL